ncbi:hypothetical protein FPZ42_08315 [Mucilaginibacter achroorhodeus]|uniref:Lipoprotein n=1 Tax=Mucilaginibacter achroorhodeus TaxID=2599294 RepID=A0A563U6P9_9SPHI|nr:hypothetical protein [Mucilaginibacter achroorhodeus]TWR27027.1 hypothetical protein FPZ42_08315 [Mucilaginibacter achroorhodeus]
MKFKSLATLTFTALTVFLYSACTKETTTRTDSDNNKAIATQIAVNLTNSLAATVASGNNYSGLPKTNSVVNGKKINDLTCGQFIEQPFDNTYTKGDSIKDVMVGSNKFVISCENNQPNGYTYTGEYVNSGFSPYLSNYKNTVKEFYTLKSLADGYTKMQIDGAQNSTYNFTTRKDGEVMVQTNTYNLKGLIIDATSKPFDITAGVAEYVSKGNNAGREFSFAGTITYLGNHKAKVTYNGQSIDITIN